LPIVTVRYDFLSRESVKVPNMGFPFGCAIAEKGTIKIKRIERYFVIWAMVLCFIIYPKVYQFRKCIFIVHLSIIPAQNLPVFPSDALAEKY
jgi:hypothetical protein